MTIFSSQIFPWRIKWYKTKNKFETECLFSRPDTRAQPGIFRLLWTPPKPSLNHAPWKNTCQIFLPPKKSWNRKFQTPKTPSIIPVTLNPEYLPPVLGSGPLSFKYVKWRWKQLLQIKTENVNPRWAHGKHNSGLFSSMKDHLTSKDR